MLQEERLARIVAVIRQQKFCSVHQLSQLTNVSPATTRRDLLQLSNSSQIRITRGGAMDVKSKTTEEETYEIKKKLNLEEKMRIGRKACDFLMTGDTAIIDTGTTLLQMSRALATADISGLTLATNDIRCAMELAKNKHISLHMLGGVIRAGYYTTVGCWTETALGGLHADKLFMSCDAIGLEDGCTITNVEEITIKQAMIRASKECTLLCDHTKFLATAFMRLCGVEKISRIVTGKELDPDTASKCREMGIEMVLV